MTDEDAYQLYLALKGAHERLCRAQVLLPEDAAGRSLLGRALVDIERVGAVWCPDSGWHT